jgi:hypothetical protein
MKHGVSFKESKIMKKILITLVFILITTLTYADIKSDFELKFNEYKKVHTEFTDLIAAIPKGMVDKELAKELDDVIYVLNIRFEHLRDRYNFIYGILDTEVDTTSWHYKQAINELNIAMWRYENQIDVLRKTIGKIKL